MFATPPEGGAMGCAGILAGDGKAHAPINQGPNETHPAGTAACCTPAADRLEFVNLWPNKTEPSSAGCYISPKQRQSEPTESSLTEALDNKPHQCCHKNRFVCKASIESYFQ